MPSNLGKLRPFRMNMKNLLLALNVLLVAAVGFLYYKVYSGNKVVTTKTSNTAAVANSNTTGAPKAMIAYVDLDSLNEHIIYIRDKRKALEAEQKAIENDYRNGMRGLETKRDNFIKNASSVTQEQAQKFQEELMQGQQNVEMRKQNALQNLGDKSGKFSEDIQKSLKSYLNDYNRDKGFTYIFTSGTGLDYMVYKDSTLNITTDVIAGMNEKLKAK